MMYVVSLFSLFCEREREKHGDDDDDVLLRT